MKITPRILFLLYLLIVVIFSTVYYLWPATLGADSLSIAKSIYFSVVTITTLGYGDVVPATDTGRLVTALEALLGIVAIGVFLNALSHRYSEQQANAISRQIEERNTQRLKTFHMLLMVVIERYERALYELTTPLAKRQPSGTFNPEFKFSDLQDLYSSSGVVINGLDRPMVQIFYDRHDDLVAELKFLIANFDLTHHRRLHDTVIHFLSTTAFSDYRSGLEYFDNVETKGGYPFTQKLQEEIKKYDEAPPDPKQFRDNILAPVIALYLGIRTQWLSFQPVKEELKKLGIADAQDTPQQGIKRRR